jgi:hypothetical protein
VVPSSFYEIYRKAVLHELRVLYLWRNDFPTSKGGMINSIGKADEQDSLSRLLFAGDKQTIIPILPLSLSCVYHDATGQNPQHGKLPQTGIMYEVRLTAGRKLEYRGRGIAGPT